MSASATGPRATSSAKSRGEHSANCKQPVPCADSEGLLTPQLTLVRPPAGCQASLVYSRRPTSAVSPTAHISQLHRSRAAPIGPPGCQDIVSRHRRPQTLTCCPSLSPGVFMLSRAGASCRGRDPASSSASAFSAERTRSTLSSVTSPSYEMRRPMRASGISSHPPKACVSRNSWRMRSTPCSHPSLNRHRVIWP